MYKTLTTQRHPFKFLTHPSKILWVFVFILVFYLWGITSLVRQSLIAEALLVIALPLFCGFFGLIKRESEGSGRVFSLLIIESFFNLLVVLSKFCIQQNWQIFNLLLSYGFVLFFIIQALGFVIYSFKLKNYFGVFNSSLFFMLIMLWFISSAKLNIIDDQGRFLFWGENTPGFIIAYYLVWLVNVVLVDTVRLPNLSQAIVSFISAIFAAVSGEFFHIRILTASHLFLLDLVFNYGGRTSKNNFFILTPASADFFKQHIKPWLPWVVSLILLVIFILSLLI